MMFFVYIVDLERREKNLFILKFVITGPRSFVSFYSGTLIDADRFYHGFQCQLIFFSFI